MIHFFEQIEHMLEEAEWASILITILIAVFLISFIVLNIITCISAVSIKKSLKKIARDDWPKKEIEKPDQTKVHIHSSEK